MEDGMNYREAGEIQVYPPIPEWIEEIIYRDETLAEVMWEIMEEKERESAAERILRESLQRWLERMTEGILYDNAYGQGRRQAYREVLWLLDNSHRT
jgi:hypothetical protein